MVVVASTPRPQFNNSTLLFSNLISRPSQAKQIEREEKFPPRTKINSFHSSHFPSFSHLSTLLLLLQATRVNSNALPNFERHQLSQLHRDSSAEKKKKMKTRAKFSGGSVAWWTLGFPAIFLLCLFFFFAGFFGSALFSQQDDSTSLRPKPRSLGSIIDEGELELWSRGDSGDDSFTSIPFQILSWKPRALYFPGFATAEQCDAIIKAAKVSLLPSSLALRNGETPENTKGIRTSSGTFMSASEDKTGVLDLIEEKIGRATMIPRSHGEPFNILRYEIGQKYNSHYDAFNPEEYGPQKSQRIASFLLYLSDVEEGGETMFPFENGQNMDLTYDFRKCLGLKVKPRRGDGLLFYSLFPNGTIDPTSLHGSCPVIEGEKWVATKWIRNEVYDD